MTRVTIVVHDDEDADEQRLDEVTRQLRRELADLDVAVEGAPGGPAPLGTRAVELAAIGTIIVTLSQSVVLAAVINAISAWLTQRQQGSVRVEMDGEALELTGSPTPQHRRLIDAWLSRREAAEPLPGEGDDAEPGPGGGRYALIVASYAYDDPGLRRLHAPAHDAERLAGVLSDPAIGGFQVQSVINESGPVVNEAVEDFFADRTADDLLLCYFSGHGVKDPDGELFFAAASTKLHRLGATAVAADFVNRRMTRSRSRRIVLILDCCYAGAFGRGMVARAGSAIAIEDQFGGRGRAVITASSAMEYAFEGRQLAETGPGQPSVFTSALVAGLETGDADRDQDGYIGLDELYDYVYERVRRATPHQTPGKWTFDVQGDLYLARRSRPVTTPARLQPELQEAIEHPLTGVRLGAVTELERLLRGRHAGTALAARLALDRLAEDDSRKVSAAATAALGSVALSEPVDAAPPDRPVVQAAPPAAVVVPEPEPEPGPSEPVPATTREPSALWAGAGLSPAKVLAAAGGVLLVLGFGMRLGDPAPQTPVTEHLQSATFVLWALIAAAFLFAMQPSNHAARRPYKRERDVVQGAVIGLAAGLLGLLAGVVSNRYFQTMVEAGFYLAAGGAVLVLAGVTLEMLPRPRGIMPIATVVSATLALVAFAGTVVVPDAVAEFVEQGDHVVWATLVFVAGSLLTVVAVTAGVLRWRITPSRPAFLLGALSTGLVIAALVWTLAQDAGLAERVAYSFLLFAALLVVALIGEDRPVLLLSARLSVIAMLLMQVPSGARADLFDAAGRFALVTLAAVAALGAFYAGHGQPGDSRT
ncbi:hypothetical protein Ait01nite_100810 [Actinoplanes italicus]|uniref:Caspase domain-containing protein n=1 Tax=Actinoplanes italicus TaxID=113567 RepID=A0A2T0JB22_9ACTN|nr:caspase family protein [Actinoplanes italicus]PRX04721.1 caspase domain-containing protein [Actinoplanes italicus]GIE37036.1 hypothetical protein Ait01nite_100810 [Actinoplanes italicus]